MIRQANNDDIPAIEALMQSEPWFWKHQWRPDVLGIAIRSAKDLAVVWEEQGRIIGFACAHDVGFRAYLSELIVALPYRRKGIGSSLLQHIEHTLAARGCSTIISDVWRTAEPFYRSLQWSDPDVLLLAKKSE